MSQNILQRPGLLESPKEDWVRVEPTLQPQATRQGTKRPTIRIATSSIMSTQPLDITPKYPIIHSPVMPSIYDLPTRLPITAGRNLYDAADGLLALARSGAIQCCQAQASYNSLFSAPDSVSATDTSTIIYATQQAHTNHSDAASVQEEDEGTPIASGKKQAYTTGHSETTSVQEEDEDASAASIGNQTHTNDSGTPSLQEECQGAQGTGSYFTPAPSEDGWNVAAWVATHANSHGHTYQREASIAPTEYCQSHSEFGSNYHDSWTNTEH